MASGFMNPPLWDEKNKEFSLWLQEAMAWKCEGSEIHRQIFDTLDTDEMEGENSW